MTVKELKEFLKAVDDDVLVAHYQHSEFAPSELTEEDFEPMELYDNGGYLSRPYAPSTKARAKKYLVLAR